MIESPIKTGCLLQNIYLAEDDADDRAIFLDALTEVCANSKCTTAFDGKHLLEVLASTVPPPPDVIFLDLNMPGKNGYDCLESIRNSSKLVSIPIVVLTTNGSPESRHKAFSLGANMFYEKPTSFSVLKKTLAGILNTDFSVSLA